MRLFKELALRHEKRGLTIGNFDGVHRGHRYLIDALRQRVGERGEVAVLTFSTHPSYVLKHLEPSPLLCSKSHKIRLLQEAGVDICFSLPFTEEFASRSYRDFLEQVRAVFPFDFLILGRGAAFGWKLEGTQQRIEELAREWGFEVIYLEKLEEISSGRIRKALAEGALDLVTRLLGRPFSILGHLEDGALKVEEKLCLPPSGKYPIVVRSEEGSCRGQALIDGQVLIQDLPFPLQGVVEAVFDPLHF